MFKFSMSRLLSMVALAATLPLAACGGGGSIDAVVGSGGTGFINGTVVKGPVGNATVTAYALAGGNPGAMVGSATTDARGNFSMAIGGHAGPVLLQASGGTYTDEATGTAMSLVPGDVMTAALPGVAAGTTTGGIQVTPLTAMAQAFAQQMSGGMTEANIAAANTALGNYFSVADIVHVQPMNPLLAGSGAGASVDARNYGMTLAAMSQYARNINMSASSALVTAMMNDAADGVMDGRKGGVQISMPMGGMMGNSMMAASAGTSGLAAAMTSFMNSSANVSGTGAADMAALIQKLTASGGHL